MEVFVVKFKSRLKEPAVKKVNCSNKIVTIYDLEYDKNHLVKVVKKGEENIYDKIQTYAGDCDFSRILKTIELSGDTSLYQNKAVSDMDLTNMPTSLAEAKKVVEKAAILGDRVSSSEYFKQKGIKFADFVKNFNEADYFQYLKNKYSKKEEDK